MKYFLTKKRYTYHVHYPYEITTPQDILETAQEKIQLSLTDLSKTLSEIVQFIRKIMMTNSGINWSVETKVNIPLKIDIVHLQ